MATNRFNYNDKLRLSRGKVGINSTSPQEKLDATSGTLKAVDLNSSGITTFSTYEGFVNKKLSYTENVNIKGGDSGTLSGEIVVGSGLTMTVGSTGVAATTGQASIECAKVFNVFIPPCGGTIDRPAASKPGALYYNKDFKTIEYWDGNFWRQVDNRTSMGRGIIAGGFVQTTTPSARELINYINIQSKGNSQYFGDLTDSRARCSAVASSTRACIQMGQYTNAIDYITIQSTGNAIDFGDTTTVGGVGIGYRSAVSSSTRGLWAGGYAPAPNNNVNSIDYIEISTLGNAQDFGDLRGPRWAAGNSGCSNSIRGVFSGGYESPNTGPAIDGNPSRIMSYVTIASLGNAVDFGKLLANLSGRTGLSNSVRGIWGGGANQASKRDSIGYITIASEGNAEYFGELSIAREMPTASSTQTRGTFAGGRTPSFVEEIEYITIATTGDALDFGDLSDQWFNGAGCSDSHGGLGGF